MRQDMEVSLRMAWGFKIQGTADVFGGLFRSYCFLPESAVSYEGGPFRVAWRRQKTISTRHNREWSDGPSFVRTKTV